jgi:E2/UBC family protein A/JAB domain-containing protein similar to deubiquitination enzymes/ThiF family protein
MALRALDDLFGEQVDWTSLQRPRARSVARLVCGGDTQGYRFLDARRACTGSETLVVQIHVDRPQRFVHALKAVETVALYFPGGDAGPLILALRDDFPDVPHAYPGHRSDPVSLCIDDRPWSEGKLNWTPSEFLVRIQVWLAKTARGELHGQARAPEPLFVAPGPVVIVDRGMMDSALAGPVELALHRPDHGLAREVLIASSPAARQPFPGLGVALIALTAARRGMGPMRFPPRTLGELADELPETDLRGYLRNKTLDWVSNSWNGRVRPCGDPDQLGWRLGLLVGFPIAREGDGEIGILDLKVFLTRVTVAEVGVALGCLDKAPDGTHGRLLKPTDGAGADAIELTCGEVHFALDRRLACQVSGRSGDTRRAVLVGAGTVGSHVAANLAREGLFTWVVIDGDYLLPHNVPRHALPATAVGHSKATAFANLLDSMCGHPDRNGHLTADVLSADPATQAAVGSALEGADIVMDASASVAVSRFLALDPNTGARRVAFFFNSDGTDAVLQIEPADRSSSLLELEAQHYAMTVELPELTGHLHASEDSIAFSGACRQATNRMPESRAALLSSLISMEIAASLQDARGKITIWRTDGASVRQIEAASADWRRLSVGDWSIVLSEQVATAISGCRRLALPAETGGVLLGVLDMEEQSIHVGLALDAPADSEGDESGFERGIAGLRARIARATEESAGQLVYVGEWHSHPEGYAATPSPKDLLQLAELADLLDRNGVPALMAIANDDGIRIHSAARHELGSTYSAVMVREARP